MNSKGLTLIETIVALMLSAILSVTAIAVVAPVFNISRRVSNAAHAQMVAENVLNTIRTEVVRAKDVSINGTTLTADGETIALDEKGYLVIDGKNPFSDEYYGDGTLEITFNKQEVGNKPDAWYVYVAVTQEGNVIAETQSSLVQIREILG